MTWQPVKCIEGMPCHDGLELVRWMTDHGTPTHYQISKSDTSECCRIGFKSNKGFHGWTHEALTIVLIDRLQTLQERKPLRRRQQTIDALCQALTYMIAKETYVAPGDET
jgi:hypothetical protein